MQKSYSNGNTKNLVFMAVFIAIILIQSWVPALGYISFGAISLTFIHVTVILSVLWLGTRYGTVIGAIWGATAMVVAYMRGTPFERLVFTNPLISLLPRILMPLILGAIVYLMNQQKIDHKITGLVAGVLGSLLNTILVLGAVGLFAGKEFLSTVPGANVDQLWPIIMGVITANGIPEAILSGIMTPLIYVALKRAMKN